MINEYVEGFPLPGVFPTTKILYAWAGVMGGKPQRLLCTWHVDKARQTELRVKAKDTLR